jgi:hypothetical protein
MLLVLRNPIRKEVIKVPKSLGLVNRLLLLPGRMQALIDLLVSILKWGTER